ncbi:MAG TPA: KH domain-containing protein [archaeon]|nr:KH domain-containing protein [archaeon]
MILVSIPQERKAVLIGKDGQAKVQIEKKTGTRIRISEEVEIKGDWETETKAAEVIKAIGRGFAPTKALRLLQGENILDVISLKGSPNTIKRLMSRVIGTGGKAKKNIEKLCQVSISIYGKTVSIIGNQKQVQLARTAIEMLISGRMHSYVWRHLEKEVTG